MFFKLKAALEIILMVCSKTKNIKSATDNTYGLLLEFHSRKNKKAEKITRKQRISATYQ